MGKYLTGTAVQFVTTQLMQARRSVMGRRWGVRDKAMALSLYNSSPKTYRLLKSIFNLPSTSTLKREMEKIRVSRP